MTSSLAAALEAADVVVATGSCSGCPVPPGRRSPARDLPAAATPEQERLAPPASDRTLDEGLLRPLRDEQTDVGDHLRLPRSAGSAEAGPPRRACP